MKQITLEFETEIIQKLFYQKQYKANMLILRLFNISNFILSIIALFPQQVYVRPPTNSFVITLCLLYEVSLFTAIHFGLIDTPFKMDMAFYLMNQKLFAFASYIIVIQTDQRTFVFLLIGFTLYIEMSLKESIFIIKLFSMFQLYTTLNIIMWSTENLIFTMETNLTFVAHMMITYYSEKQDRQSFQDDYYHQLQDQCYKYIMTDVFSDSCVLIKQITEFNQQNLQQDDFELLPKSNGEDQSLQNYLDLEDNDEILQVNNINTLYKFLESLTIVNPEILKGYKDIQTLLQSILENECLYEVNKYQFRCIKSNTQKKKVEQYKIDIFTMWWRKQNSVAIIIQSTSASEKCKEYEIHDQKKDLMFAQISHDLKGPTNNIQNYVKKAQIILWQLIEQCQIKESLYQEINCNLQQMNYNAQYLMNMICDFLDIGLIQQGILEPRFNKYIMKELIKDVIDLENNQAVIQNTSLLVFWKFSELQFNNDQRRIQQILINLISNSLKFTLKGGTIQLVMIEYESENLIYIQIIDSGVGIKPEIIPQLQIPYNSFDNEQKLNKKGLGLGLFICKNLVRILGPCEHVLIESQVGQGTTMSFFIYKDVESMTQFPQDSINQSNYKIILNELDKCIPFSLKIIKPLLQNQTFYRYNLRAKLLQTLDSEDFEETLTKTERNTTYKLAKFPKEDNQQTFQNELDVNICIADDQPFNLIYLENLIKEIKLFKFKIQKVLNGEQLLSLFKKMNHKSKRDPIQLIITDIEMPLLNGFDSCLKIKKLIQGQNYHDCKVIALTGHNTDSIKDQCIISKFDDCLSKQVQNDELKNIIINHLI